MGERKHLEIIVREVVGPGEVARAGCAGCGGVPFQQSVQEQNIGLGPVHRVPLARDQPLAGEDGLKEIACAGPADWTQGRWAIWPGGHAIHEVRIQLGVLWHAGQGGGGGEVAEWANGPVTRGVARDKEAWVRGCVGACDCAWLCVCLCFVFG